MHSAAREGKDVVRHYLDVLVAGDLEGIRECFAPDATWTIFGDLPIAGPWHGRDEIVDEFLATVGARLFRAGTQSFEFPLMIGDGENVALEWRVRAQSAAGAEYENSYCGIFIVREGLIAEVREYLDSGYAKRVLFPDS